MRKIKEAQPGIMITSSEPIEPIQDTRPVQIQLSTGGSSQPVSTPAPDGGLGAFLVIIGLTILAKVLLDK